MGSIKVDTRELQQFAERLNKMSQPKYTEQLYDKCIRELAMLYLEAVKKITPVGDTIKGYENVKDKDGNEVMYKRNSKYHKKGEVKQKKVTLHTGGNLRQSWTVQIKKIGGLYKAIITNVAEYASYVNYGHRQTPGRYVKAIGKRLKASWVNGQFFLEITEAEIQRIMPLFLQKKLDNYVKEVLNGGTK